MTARPICALVAAAIACGCAGTIKDVDPTSKYYRSNAGRFSSDAETKHALSTTAYVVGALALSVGAATVAASHDSDSDADRIGTATAVGGVGFIVSGLALQLLGNVAQAKADNQLYLARQAEAEEALVCKASQ